MALVALGLYVVQLFSGRINTTKYIKGISKNATRVNQKKLFLWGEFLEACPTKLFRRGLVF